MASPTKEDLPKCPTDFKKELEKFDSGKMKHAATQEKNSLPSKEDIKREKQQIDIIVGVKSFNKGKLKRADTLEKDVLPTKEDVEQEKQRQELLTGVSTFNKAKLKRTNTKEKIVLPTKEVLSQEKIYNASQEVLACLNGFDKSRLRKTKTIVKDIKPTKEMIDQEKAMGTMLQGIQSFDPAKLKPTETAEKNPLPTKEVQVHSVGHMVSSDDGEIKSALKTLIQLQNNSTVSINNRFDALMSKLDSLKNWMSATDKKLQDLDDRLCILETLAL